MTPQAREIIKAVAEEYRVAPSQIVTHCRKDYVVAARIEVAKRLRARNYSTPQIGRILSLHHTTVLHYLGRLSSRRPPKPRKKFLVAYVGHDRDYVWKERPYDRREEVSQDRADPAAAHRSC